LENEPLGIIVGEAQPHKFAFLAKRGVKVGEYVVVEFPEGPVLGMVEASIARSSLINAVDNYFDALEGRRIALKNKRDKSYIAYVKTMGLLEDLKKGTVTIPSLAPEPGSEVKEADNSVLEEVFCRKGEQWSIVGTLLRNREVSVSVNIDKLASRHLAILAATGGGKSNLLALLAKKISKINGTMVIFDYHGEYVELDIPNVRHGIAKINPRLMDPEELADLLDVSESSSVQRSVLSRALNEKVLNAKDFWKALCESLNEIRDKMESEKNRQEVRAAERLIDIINLALKRIGAILDPDISDPLDQIKPYHINVLDMSELTERQADIIAAYYLEEILGDRKRARRLKMSKEKDGMVRFMEPVVCAIEEAHVFIPSDERRNTKTKYIASKIAREGRKFGVSLIVVSQRPSKLDQDVLSQMGSFAVMRIIQPRDQNYIINVCEMVSEDLASYLPSLNVGEALLLGQWVNLPSIVKIEKVEEKVMGADISAVKEWTERVEISEIAKVNTSELIRTD